MIEVAAGVLLRADGSFLLAQRPAGKVYAGYWEFPGGKIEPGEPLAQALARLHLAAGEFPVAGVDLACRALREKERAVRAQQDSRGNLNHFFLTWRPAQSRANW